MQVDSNIAHMIPEDIANDPQQLRLFCERTMQSFQKILLHIEESEEHHEPIILEGVSDSNQDVTVIRNVRHTLSISGEFTSYGVIGVTITSRG
jgi:hypothetical protein